MWQDILQILAIIGIILLVLVALAVLLIGLVFFVPIRYRVEADVDTQDKHYLIKGKASWLLNILTVTGGYPEPSGLTVRLFGYPIKKIDFNATQDEQDEDSSEKTQSEGSQSEENQKQINDSEESLILDSNEPSTIEEIPINENAKQKSKTLSEWYQKIVCTIKKLCDKIKEIWNTIQYYKNVLDEKQTRLFIDRSKKRLGKLLKAFSPKRIKGSLKVGTGSPDTTGYLVAIYGMMVPYLDKEFSLDPDFESAVCCGKITAKGRIYLWTVLTVFVGFTSDKYLSILLKKLKREEQ